MSWGYWGILASLLLLLTLFFFCIDLLYDAQQKMARMRKTDAEPGTGTPPKDSDTKHAA